jgi:DNA-binding CsgD family transcriptional regulator
MQWVKTSESLPNTNIKNILVVGAKGGVYQPNSIRVDEEGVCFARVNGVEREFFAYFEYPEPPIFKRGEERKKELVGKRMRKRDLLIWPLNMLAEIDVEAFRGCIYLNTPPDNFENNWDLAKESISEREATVIEMYFRNRKTLQQIAAELRLTRERIRQILGKAIRKLRHSSRINILIGGIGIEEHRPIEEHRISNEHLSVRAFNSLMKANVQTVGELLRISEEKIRNIRGVGVTTSDEILAYKAKIEQETRKE